MELYYPESIKDIKKIQLKAHAYFSNSKDDGTKGIAGSTFRAYRGFRKKPSEVYRSWVDKIMENEPMLQKDQLKSRQDFLKLHQKLQVSLDKYWYRYQKKKLSISQRNKIIDLFIKHIARTRQLKSLIKFGNIPLDKFSLLLMKKYFYGLVISPTPSMGDIDCDKTYDFLQEQIWNFMKRANLPNLYFDYYAWNHFH